MNPHSTEPRSASWVHVCHHVPTLLLRNHLTKAQLLHLRAEKIKHESRHQDRDRHIEIMITAQYWHCHERLPKERR